MDVTIHEMTLGDVDEALDLWRTTEGICLNESDDKLNLARYFRRNPGLSFVARHEGNLIGAVLCGHDGRRGYLHHLAVKKDFRRRGIGGELAARCMSGLQLAGIPRCNIFILNENASALAFWKQAGWTGPGWIILQKPTK